MVGEIQGLNPGFDGIKPVENKKVQKVSVDPVPASDSVTLSGELTELLAADSASIDFPPRLEKIDEVKSRIANQDYSSPDVVEDIAARVADSPSLVEIEIEHAAMDAADETGEADVEAVQANAEEGYYNSPDVVLSIAENLIDILGVDGLI